mgnify:FL=1
MRSMERRSFIKYVGAGALASPSVLGPLMQTARGAASEGAWVNPDGTPTWTPVPYPIPLPADPGSAASDASLSLIHI